MELTLFGRCCQTCRALLSQRFPNIPLAYRSGFPDGILLCSPTAVHPSVLAIPHSGEHLAMHFPRAAVVTCGMSARDSVSCSSLGDGCAILSVVRELPIIGGGFVDVQDICLPLRVPTDAEPIVLCTAICLCAGFPPQM